MGSVQTNSQSGKGNAQTPQGTSQIKISFLNSKRMKVLPKNDNKPTQPSAENTHGEQSGEQSRDSRVQQEGEQSGQPSMYIAKSFGAYSKLSQPPCKVSKLDEWLLDANYETFDEVHPLGVELMMTEMFTCSDKYRKYTCLYLREIFLYVAILFSILAFIHSVIKVSLCLDCGEVEMRCKNNTIVTNIRITQVVCTSICLLFSFLDLIIYLRFNGFRLLRFCYSNLCLKCCKDCYEKSEEKCGTTCCNDKLEDDKPACCPNSCCNHTISVMDGVRIFVMETLFYPSLLMGIFEFIIHLDKKEFDASKLCVVDWLAFLIPTICSVFLNYTLKLVPIFQALYYTCKRVQSYRLQLQIITISMQSLGQIILQIIMIVMIGAKFQLVYAVGDSTNGKVVYMMVWGYFAPVVGVIMFLVLHHIWTFNLPVSLVYNLDKCHESTFNENENSIIQNLKNTQHYNQFKVDYKEYNKKIHCCKKLFNPLPLFSPFQVIVSIVNFLLLIAFFICYFVDSNNATLHGEMIVVGVVALILSLVLNYYVFLIGGLLVIIVVASIIIPVMIILCFIIGIVLLVICAIIKLVQCCTESQNE
jgi:hypothetical protein